METSARDHRIFSMQLSHTPTRGWVHALPQVQLHVIETAKNSVGEESGACRQGQGGNIASASYIEYRRMQP